MISFSKEALTIITQKQIATLITLDSSPGRSFSSDIRVTTDYHGYVAVIIPYKANTIYGGISPEGELST